MGTKMLSIFFCKCINKMYCICKSLMAPQGVTHQVSEKDLAEWKRIEHVDQFIQKRH